MWQAMLILPLGTILAVITAVGGATASFGIDPVGGGALAVLSGVLAFILTKHMPAQQKEHKETIEALLKQHELERSRTAESQIVERERYMDLLLRFETAIDGLRSSIDKMIAFNGPEAEIVLRDQLRLTKELTVQLEKLKGTAA